MTLLRQDCETIAFRGATAAALLHAIDDALISRQPGVALGQHAVAAVISLAAGVAAIVAFPRLRPGFRAGISLVFGVLAIVNESPFMSPTSRSTLQQQATSPASSH